MPRVAILNYGSLEEAKAGVEDIKSVFLKDAVVALRGINLTDDEQVEFSKFLGDNLNWVPNTTSGFKQRYQEDHSKNETKSTTNGAEVALPWHLEHVDYDQDVPIVAGLWNMTLFTCDPSVGRTYFIDSAKIYRSMPKDWQDFLANCVSEWYRVDGLGPFLTSCVQSHWYTGEPVVRIDITDATSRSDLLHSVGGEAPSDSERSLYCKIRDYFIKEVYENEPFRLIHEWQQGDLVIPDLFRMAHAVTGGFESSQRSFIGYWAYSEEPKER